MFSSSTGITMEKYSAILPYLLYNLHVRQQITVLYIRQQMNVTTSTQQVNSNKYDNKW